MAPHRSFSVARAIDRSLKIVFIGPPGSGKGTQCERLSQHLSVPHISTGNMLRSLEGDAAEMIRLRIDRGNFAPDEFILSMVEDRLLADDCGRGYLLDGFPRTLVQAEAFTLRLRSRDDALEHVVHLNVGLAVLADRLRLRGQSGTRLDDAVDLIQKRFRIYEERTAPLLDYYRSQGLVRDLDGTPSADEVFSQLCNLVRQSSC